MIPRILIVDDERDIIDSLKVGLARRGFEVDVTDDPREAIDRFAPKKYDIVFLDMKMPTMDGFELYKEIKAKDMNARVVFLTAFEINPDTISKVLPDISVKDFVHKPVSISKLVDFIREQICDRR